jgi:hypothetical protein
VPARFSGQYCCCGEGRRACLPAGPAGSHSDIGQPCDADPVQSCNRGRNESGRSTGAGAKEMQMNSGEKSLHWLVDKWLAPTAAMPAHVIQFGHTHSSKGRYVALRDRDRPARLRSSLDMATAQGAWFHPRPNGQRRMLVCAHADGADPAIRSACDASLPVLTPYFLPALDGPRQSRSQRSLTRAPCSATPPPAMLSAANRARRSGDR